METSLAIYRRALTRGVHHVCRGTDCRILQDLPELVDIVGEVRSNWLAAYDQAIRRQLCSGCESQDASGHCPLRVMGQCCLSSELRPVVNIIKRLLDARAAAEDASPT